MKANVIIARHHHNSRRVEEKAKAANALKTTINMLEEAMNNIGEGAEEEGLGAGICLPLLISSKNMLSPLSELM